MPDIYFSWLVSPWLYHFHWERSWESQSASFYYFSQISNPFSGGRGWQNMHWPACCWLSQQPLSGIIYIRKTHFSSESKIFLQAGTLLSKAGLPTPSTWPFRLPAKKAFISV